MFRKQLTEKAVNLLGFFCHKVIIFLSSNVDLFKLGGVVHHFLHAIDVVNTIDDDNRVAFVGFVDHDFFIRRKFLEGIIFRFGKVQFF